MKLIDMRNAVKPLVIHQKNDHRMFTFAGTGFFLSHGDKQLLVTANHVHQDHPLSVMVFPEGQTPFTFSEILVPAKPLAKDVDHDLAIFALEQPIKNSHPLEIAQSTPAGNSRIGSIEYARLRIDKSKQHIIQNPSSRIGNLVRHAADTNYPFMMLELSFPALRGASGAPVIYSDGPEIFKVIGVIVANAQYELMPVQKYKYKDKTGETEETHYYLPAALAVPVSHLQELLTTI